MTDLEKAEELARWIESLDSWTLSSESHATHRERANLIRSLISEVKELRQKVSKMEDEWYSPAHMDAVEERTIKPLQQAKEALDYLIINEWEAIRTILVCTTADSEPPPYLKSILEKERKA